MLTASNLSCGYGNTNVLVDVSINVQPGEIVSIIGANGAGKTTLLMTLSRFIALRAGSIFFEGQDLAQVPPHELVPSGLAHVPEGRKIFSRLTVDENLSMGAYTVTSEPRRQENLARAYALFPVLKERAKQSAGTLSGGEQQMLAIARALMCSPRLLMLDEPSMGVAPKLVEKIFSTLVDLNKQGVTLLLVEQDAHAALAISNRAYVLESGKVSFTGSGQQLLHDERVKRAYLGES